MGKQTWNMIDGGYIQFSIDTALASTDVNNNFYLTSPNSEQFWSNRYCDVQEYGYDDNNNCLELDITENNGNCRSHFGVHTFPDNAGGCDRAGCYGRTNLSGKRTYRMTFDSDGGFTLMYQLHEQTAWHEIPITD